MTVLGVARPFSGELHAPLLTFLRVLSIALCDDVRQPRLTTSTGCIENLAHGA